MSHSPLVKDYLNYREFLRSYYETHKAQNKGFSYTVFANLAGFKSRNFIRDVIGGQKNLSSESVFKLQNVLKLGKRDFAYFQALVEYNQASESEEKAHAFDKVMSMAGNHSVWRVRKEQFDFYSRCYHNSLRELLRFYPGPHCVEDLSQKLLADITPREIKRSLELMCDLGLLKEKKGTYSPVNEAITTGDEVISQAIIDFHKENLRLAARSLSEIPPTERDISCLVLSLSSETYVKVKEKMQSFRKDIAALCDKDSNPEQVIHLAMQAFPTTKSVKTKEGK